MNIHAPNNRNDWLSFEFVGKRWVKYNKTWMKAFSHGTNRTYYYCFEDNLFCEKRFYDDLNRALV